MHAAVDGALGVLARAAHVQQHQAGDGRPGVAELVHGQPAGGPDGLRVPAERRRRVHGAGHRVHAHPGQPQPGVAGPAGLAHQDDVAARDLRGVLGEAAVEPHVDRAAQVPAGELLGGADVEHDRAAVLPPQYLLQ